MPTRKQIVRRCRRCRQESLNYTQGNIKVVTGRVGCLPKKPAEYHRLDNSPEMLKLADLLGTHVIVSGEYADANNIVRKSKPAKPQNARTGGKE